MIIWTGWGFLALIIAIMPAIAIESVLSAALGPAYYRTHIGPKAVSWVLSSIALWAIGSWLAQRPGRTVIDKETGQEMVLGAKHTLFWIPVRFWALPVLAFGLWTVFEGISRGDPW